MNFVKWLKQQITPVLIISFFVITILYLNYIATHIENTMERLAQLFLIESGVIVDCSQYNEEQAAD